MHLSAHLALHKFNRRDSVADTLSDAEDNLRTARGIVIGLAISMAGFWIPLGLYWVLR